MMLTLTGKELALLLKNNPDSIDLIDVRERKEYNEVHIPKARNIPLHILPMKLSEIDTQKQVIFICRSGARSAQATSFVENVGIKGYNLIGGMNDFEKAFPDAIIRKKKKKLFGVFSYSHVS